METHHDPIADDATSNFIHMLTVRIGDLEAKVDKLLAKNEQTSPDLFLRPESDYLMFSDGYRLHWRLFGVVQMRTNKNDGYKLLPVDEQHLDAVVSDRGLMIHAPTEPTKIFFTGHPCRHLKLRECINEVHANIIDDRRAACNETYREHFNKKNTCSSYPCGLDDNDEFRGFRLHDMFGHKLSSSGPHLTVRRI